MITRIALTGFLLPGFVAALLGAAQPARVAGAAPPPSSQPVATRPATTQPAASQSAATSRSARSTEQAELIQTLLSERQRSSLVVPIEAQPAENKGITASEPAPSGGALLPEGTMLVERPGRLVREDGKSMFVFHAIGDETTTRSIELLPNGFLEVMEREADAGLPDFVVTGEVTLYKGHNYLLVTKSIRRVANGNLSP
jgi:hypothetical protein